MRFPGKRKKRIPRRIVVRTIDESPALAALRAEYTEKGFTTFFSCAEKEVSNAVYFSPAPPSDGELPVGASKFGGSPDLPAGAVPPVNDAGRPLDFICQINLEEAAAYDAERRLPQKGLLSLFYDFSADGVTGYGKNDRKAFALIYTDGSSPLMRAGFRAAREERALIFEKRYELPDVDSDLVNREKIEEEELSRIYRKKDEEADEAKPRHKLLGHANIIQHPMEKDCDLLAKGYDLPGEDAYAKAERDGVSPDAHAWVLLLQIDSCDDPGFHFGDGGRLYLYIGKDDLKSARFDNARLIIQSY